MAYPLRFPEKAPKGTKQGAKLPEVSKQGREIGVFLAFSRIPSSVKQIEQDLRRRTLYPAELLRQVICSAILHLNGKNVNAPGEKCGKTLAFCFLRAYNTKVSAENAPRYRISHEKGAFTIAEQ